MTPKFSPAETVTQEPLVSSLEQAFRIASGERIPTPSEFDSFRGYVAEFRPNVSSLDPERVVYARTGEQGIEAVYSDEYQQYLQAARPEHWALDERERARLGGILQANRINEVPGYNAGRHRSPDTDGTYEEDAIALMELQDDASRRIGLADALREERLYKVWSESRHALRAGLLGTSDHSALDALRNTSLDERTKGVRANVDNGQPDIMGAPLSAPNSTENQPTPAAKKRSFLRALGSIASRLTNLGR